MVAAKNYVQDELDEAFASMQDATEFFLPDSVAPGTCIVANNDMIGIAENPGFPPPVIYKMCNCISMINTGAEACTFQAYFTGFAMSTGGSRALKFDIAQQLEGGDDFRLYDGFAKYEFGPSGDLWASMSLAWKVPKFYSSLELIGRTIEDIVCSPKRPGVEMKEPKSNFKNIKQVTIDASMFIKTSSNGDPETLTLLAIEEIRVVLINFFSFRVGNAFGALRLNTADQTCQPSGLFASINLGTDFALGAGIREFLNVPNPQVQADFGITWLDPMPEDSADAVQSIFLRLEWSGIKLMGFEVPDTTVEIQYIDDIEFQRRRDFDKDTCCNLDNVADNATCGAIASPITDFVLDPNNSPQPTLALFFEVDRIPFFGNIIVWSDILVEFFLQVPENDGDVYRIRLAFEITVSVLFIEDLDIKASIETITETNGETDVYAEFFAGARVNVGLGVAICTVHAIAIVTDLKYEVESDEDAEAEIENRMLFGNRTSPAHRDLQTIGGLTLADANFSLDVDVDFEVAEWLEDLGQLVLEGLGVVYDGLNAAWGAIEDFAEGLWNAASEIANLIGGAITDAFNVAIDQILQGVNVISEAFDTFVDIFDNVPVAGPLASAIGAIGEGIFDTVSKAAEIGAAIFNGDWDKVGDIFAGIGADIGGAFGFGKKIKNKTLMTYDDGRTDQYLNCPLVYYQWEQCKKRFFKTCCCKTKRGNDFPEETCSEERSGQMKDIEDNIRKSNESEACRLSSEGRNQGIKWVGENPEAANSTLKPTMKNVTQPLGSIRNMTDGICKKIPLNLEVEKLATSSPGVDGLAESSGMSDDCIVFTDKAALQGSLADLKLQASDKMKDMSRGNQGLDKDGTVKTCSEEAGLSCPLPGIKEGYGFKETHTITCDVDIRSLQLNQIFGGVDVIAPICDASEVQQGFKHKGSVTDEEDGCASTTISFERYGTDCCNQRTQNSLYHKLIIEVRPPRFTTLPGAIDQTLKCDENVFPEISGIPSPGWEVGCPDGSIEEEINDSDPMFDPNTCQTTFIRTFTLIEDGCMENAVNFEQNFVLVNDYDPEWDYFPPDITIDVFAQYGTDGTGFPTVFQKCGASPIRVAYEDEFELGSCFAERVLTRTFTAVDVCGHTTTRSQKITITNPADALPLGPKSLARFYGAKHAHVNKPHRDICLHPSDSCGIFGAPTNYRCGTATFDEIYNDFLITLSEEPNLEKGPSEISFECPDATCDGRATYEEDFERSILYRTQQVRSAAISHGTAIATQDSLVNKGGSYSRDISCGSLSKFGGPLFSKEKCTEISLTGTNEMYNIFDIRARDFESNNFVINVPSTSIALINVASDPGEKIVVSKYWVTGVRLHGVSAHNVLWNIPSGLKWTVNKLNRKPYSFYGTILNRGGEMQFIFPYPNKKENNWVGQVFGDRIRIDEPNMPCGGHFTGFANCANVA